MPATPGAGTRRLARHERTPRGNRTTPTRARRSTYWQCSPLNGCRFRLQGPSARIAALAISDNAQRLRTFRTLVCRRLLRLLRYRRKAATGARFALGCAGARFPAARAHERALRRDRLRFVTAPALNSERFVIAAPGCPAEKFITAHSTPPFPLPRYLRHRS